MYKSAIFPDKSGRGVERSEELILNDNSRDFFPRSAGSISKACVEGEGHDVFILSRSGNFISKHREEK